MFFLFSEGWSAGTALGGEEKGVLRVHIFGSSRFNLAVGFYRGGFEGFSEGIRQVLPVGCESIDGLRGRERKKGLFGSLKAVKVGAGLGLRENYGRWSIS